MKPIVSTLMALLLVTGAATGVHSQSAESAPAENSSAQAPAETQTITGRVTRVHPRGGTFTVTDSTSGKSITLHRGALNIRRFQRGKRVTVTYRQNTAISVKPERSAQ